MEIAFWIGFLEREPDEAARLFMADEHSSSAARAKLLADLLEPAAAEPFRLISQKADAEYRLGPKKLRMEELAARSGLGDTYAYYRTLCAVSVHPSMSPLDKLIEPNDDGTLGLRAGPDDNGIPFSLMNAINAQDWGLSAYARFFGMSDAVRALEPIQADRDKLLMAMR